MHAPRLRPVVFTQTPIGRGHRRNSGFLETNTHAGHQYSDTEKRGVKIGIIVVHAFSHTALGKRGSPVGEQLVLIVSAHENF